MKIITLPIDEIIPYERNPRKNDGAVEAVAASIREFGFKVPIVVDAQNVIVTGHTRHKAARKLGLSECPCIRADDLTPEQVRAYRLADNKVAELAEWDFDLLAAELEGLDFDGWGLKWEIDTDQTPPAVGEDDFTEMPETSDIERGDMFALGPHRLLCGSSTDDEEVAALMGEEKGKIIFTSPPYSDIREYGGNKDLSLDNLSKFIISYKPYTDYQCVNLGIKRENASVVEYWGEYIKKAHDAGYKLLAWNVWDKMKCGSVGQQSAFFPIRHEFIFVFGTKPFEINRTIEKKEENITSTYKGTTRNKNGKMVLNNRGETFHKLKKMESVVSIYPENGTIRKKHPATMPVKLPGAYINAMTQPGEIVIEPFCGSGTTIIAAEQCGRKCYAMELDPYYCRVIIARWEQFTGRKAERIA